MKTGQSLQELASELERQMKTKRDFVAPTQRLRLDNDRLAVEGQGDFGVTQHAHRQIAQRLGIPQKYYDRMKSDAPQLLESNVNHWFADKPERRLVRTIDDNARAFLSATYRQLDNYDLAENSLPILQSRGCRVESAALTDSRLYIKAFTERVTFEVKKGDVVQAGIVISNSEIGLGSVKVEPMILRLVCTNGMIANDYAMRKYHVGRRTHDGGDLAQEFFKDETRKADDKAFWLKVRDTISGALDSDVFGKIVGKMRTTTERPIEADVVEVVDRVQERHQLNDDEKSGVLKHLISGGDLTQYGLLNAVTRTSQDVSDYDRATELERLGGEILELKESEWTVLGGKSKN